MCIVYTAYIHIRECVRMKCVCINILSFAHFLSSFFFFVLFISLLSFCILFSFALSKIVCLESVHSYAQTPYSNRDRCVFLLKIARTHSKYMALFSNRLRAHHMMKIIMKIAKCISHSPINVILL